MNDSDTTDIGAVDDFPEGEPILVELPDITLAVFNVEGQLYALDDMCSHGQASLADGDLLGFEVVCSWHFGRFDIRTGKACKFPATKPVRSHRLTVVDGRVLLDRDIPDSVEDEAVAS